MASLATEKTVTKGPDAAPDADVILPVPNLTVAQDVFTLSQPNLSHLHDKARASLLKGLEDDEMGPFLESLGSSIDLGPSASALLTKLKEKNEAELKSLNDKVEDAKSNLGETEISEALRAKATYLARIGTKKEAEEAYNEALEKVVGIGSRIDLRLAIIRVGFFHGDFNLVSSNITKATQLADEGGDWDRRNRLKAYNGLYSLSIRDFKKAGELLLDILSTFAATEIMSYEEFISYCIISGVLTLERVDYKKKIINSPEVIGALPQLPHLKDYSNSLYNCEYAKFFQSLAEIEQAYLIPSRCLSRHTRFYVREMRIKAYAQLLESYRSVTMSSLCTAFGVNETWLDADLARFIAAGRLNFSIDKVNRVVETNRPDARNAQYEQVVKQGDALLNNVQKVARALGTSA